MAISFVLGTLLAIVGGLLLIRFKPTLSIWYWRNKTERSRLARWAKRTLAVASVVSVGVLALLVCLVFALFQVGAVRLHALHVSQPLRTLICDEGPVTGVCFSPDGKQVVTASHNGTVKVWDTDTGVAQLTRKGGIASVTGVCFSPDGKRVVTGSLDGTAKVWDAETGRQVLSFKGRTASVTGVCFSPDGKRVVTGNHDGTAKVWDAETGRELRELRGHTDPVTGVCFSPDGKRVLRASRDGRVRVWDANTGREQFTLGGRTASVTGVCVSPDGKRVLAGVNDGTVQVWDAATGQEQFTLGSRTASVTGVCVSPDGKRVLAGGGDGKVRAWDIDTRQEQRTLQGHADSVSSVCFSPDGKQVVTGSRDGTAKVWDADTGRELFTLGGHTASVTGVCVSPDGKRVVTGSHDGTAKVWDADTGREQFTLEEPTASVSSVCVSPDGKRVLIVGKDKDKAKDEVTVKVLDVDTRGEQRTLEVDTRSVTSTCFIPGGKRVLLVSRETSMRVWDADTGREQDRYWGRHDSDATSVCFSPDGKLVVTGHHDGTVLVWDADKGRLESTLGGRTASVTRSVTSVCFSPNGKRVLAGGEDGKVRVWNFTTEEEHRTLWGHTGTVTDVCFSPDGKRVVTGSRDGTARVWNAGTGRVEFILEGRAGAVTGVCFSPDGKRVVTGNHDGTARVWDAADTGVSVLVQLVCLLAISVIGLIFYILFLSPNHRIRCWQKILRLVEPTLVTHPELAREVCGKAIRQLGWTQAASRKTRGKRLNSLSLAHVLTAILEFRNGQTTKAAASVDLARSCASREVAKRGWTVKYYAATGCSSSGAVETCLAYLREPWDSEDMPSSEQVVGALRSACRVTAELTPPELTDRVRWNQEVKKAFPGESWPQVHEGQAWQRLGRPERAKRVFDDVLVRYPDNWQARSSSARVLAALGQQDQAQCELDDLQEQYADAPEVLLDVARNRAAIGDLAGAQGVAEAIKNHPEYLSPAQVLIGMVLVRQSRPHEAIPVLREVIDRTPGDTETVLTLAEALSLTGDDREAVQLIRTIATDSNSPRVKFALGCALFNVGEDLEAANNFAWCARAEYRVRESRVLRVRCLIRAKQYDLASATLEEMDPADRDDPDVAFLFGVVNLGLGAPGAALPYFVRTFNAAREGKNRVLAARAKANICACQVRMAEAFVVEERYEAAAKAFEMVLKNLPQVSPEREAVSRNVGECYLRAALQALPAKALRAKGHRIGPAVLTLAEKAASAGGRPAVDGFLAGLYFTEGRFDDAARIYDRLRKGAVEQDEADFHWALAASRIEGGEQRPSEVALGDGPESRPGHGNRSPVDPLARLTELAVGSGPHSTRAALALAARERAAGDHRRAGEILLRCLDRSPPDTDGYYGEACGQAVLDQWRVGDISAALTQSTRLYKGVCDSPKLVLGALLAGEGEYDSALPHLTAALPPGKRPAVGWEVLRGVCLRLAARQCLRSDFTGAMTTLEIALGRSADPVLGYLHRLAATTQAKAGSNGGELENRDLELFADLQKASPKPDPLLIRCQLVAYQRRACNLALEGDHVKAGEFWDRAHGIWDQFVRQQKVFWTDYIADYNNGQQYELTLRPEELEKQIATRVTGLYLGICVSLIEDRESLTGGRTLKTARKYWRLACGVAGESRAREFFTQHFPADRFLKAFPGRDLSEFYAAFASAFDNDEVKPEHRNALGEMHYRLAVYALSQGEADVFFDHLDTCGKWDANTRELADKCRKLGTDTIVLISRRYRAHSRVKVLARDNQEEADRRLFQLVIMLVRVIDERPLLRHMLNTGSTTLLDSVIEALFRDDTTG